MSHAKSSISETAESAWAVALGHSAATVEHLCRRAKPDGARFQIAPTSWFSPKRARPGSNSCAPELLRNNPFGIRRLDSHRLGIPPRVRQVTHADGQVMFGLRWHKQALGRSLGWRSPVERTGCDRAGRAHISPRSSVSTPKQIATISESNGGLGRPRHHRRRYVGGCLLPAVWGSLADRPR